MLRFSAVVRPRPGELRRRRDAAYLPIIWGADLLYGRPPRRDDTYVLCEVKIVFLEVV
jgi:hypothetical protein